jgi:hypothetical protein
MTNMVMTANPVATRPSVDELTAQVHTPNHALRCTGIFGMHSNAGSTKQMDKAKATTESTCYVTAWIAFFLHEVKTKAIVPKSVRRLAAALQFFANNYE